MIRREEVVKIGQFNKPHGVNGELGFTFTDDVFDRGESPYIICEVDGIFVPFFIEEYRFRSENSALMKLEDVDTEEEARSFVNRVVYYPKSFYIDEETEVAPGDYFIGFKVIDEEYGELGVIESVDDSTANILFVVEYQGRELLIPANDDFVTALDEKHKIIRMNIPEGLLDM